MTGLSRAVNCASLVVVAYVICELYVLYEINSTQTYLSMLFLLEIKHGLMNELTAVM